MLYKEEKKNIFLFRKYQPTRSSASDNGWRKIVKFCLVWCIGPGQKFAYSAVYFFRRRLTYVYIEF